MTPDRKRIVAILWIARKPRCGLSWTTIFASITSVLTVLGGKPVHGSVRGSMCDSKGVTA
jgi:hypothetical protein